MVAVVVVVVMVVVVVVVVCGGRGAPYHALQMDCRYPDLGGQSWHRRRRGNVSLLTASA